MTGPLVVGVGHPDRGDDALGSMVAEHLALQTDNRFTVRALSGDCMRLVEWLGQYDPVVIVDACRSGAEPGSIHIFDAAALPAYRGSVSSHGFGVAEAIALAQSLDGMPERCVVIAVEGGCFDLGSGLSAAMRDALPRVHGAIDAALQGGTGRLSGMA